MAGVGICQRGGAGRGRAEWAVCAAAGGLRPHVPLWAGMALQTPCSLGHEADLFPPRHGKGLQNACILHASLNLLSF